MIASKKIPVNPLLLMILFFSLGLSNCGFQLNRNQIQLPENAKSISIDQIENQSFIPRLDLELKDVLVDLFARNSVDITNLNTADLSLSFQIKATSITKSEYALDNASNTQSYQFDFLISGVLNVMNHSKQSKYIDNITINGSHSIKTQSQDLTQTEIEEGRYKTLTNLGKKITTKLTQNF